MKKIKFKILFITSLVCLLPMLLGVALWSKLPDSIATHFDINFNPDAYSSKSFFVFGLPVMMAVLQIVCCIINDLKVSIQSDIKVQYVFKWIIPLMCVALYVSTIGYSMGYIVDMRIAILAIVGILFVAAGGCITKLDYVKNYNVDTQKAKKINRFTGFGMVALGILFLISTILPPIASSISLLLIIPYALVSILYYVIIIKKP